MMYLKGGSRCPASAFSYQAMVASTKGIGCMSRRWAKWTSEPTNQAPNQRKQARRDNQSKKQQISHLLILIKLALRSIWSSYWNKQKQFLFSTRLTMTRIFLLFCVIRLRRVLLVNVHTERCNKFVSEENYKMISMYQAYYLSPLWLCHSP